MRTALMSELERKMLRDYLRKGSKPEDFRVLMHRIKKSIKRIREDYELILAVLDKEK